MSIAWHHGTCDHCGKRNTLVCHFGYDTQPDRDYRMCKEDLLEEMDIISHCLPLKKRKRLLEDIPK